METEPVVKAESTRRSPVAPGSPKKPPLPYVPVERARHPISQSLKLRAEIGPIGLTAAELLAEGDEVDG